jgi:hypothetical protein
MFEKALSVRPQTTSHKSLKKIKMLVIVSLLSQREVEWACWAWQEGNGSNSETSGNYFSGTFLLPNMGEGGSIVEQESMAKEPKSSFYGTIFNGDYTKEQGRVFFESSKNFFSWLASCFDGWHCLKWRARLLLEYSFPQWKQTSLSF